MQYLSYAAILNYKFLKYVGALKKYLPTFFQSMHSEGGSRPRGSHKAPGVSSWWALKLEGK